MTETSRLVTIKESTLQNRQKSSLLGSHSMKEMVGTASKEENGSLGGAASTLGKNSSSKNLF